MRDVTASTAAVLCTGVASPEWDDIGDKESYRELVREGSLKWCRDPALAWYPKPVNAVLHREPTQAIGRPFAAGAVVIRRELFRFLEPHVTTQIVGRVFIKEGDVKREATTCVTLYDTTPHEVQVFGQVGRPYDCCEKCGRTLGGEAHDGMWITKRQREGWDIAFWGMSLLLSPRVAASVAWEEFPSVKTWAVRFRN